MLKISSVQHPALGPLVRVEGIAARTLLLMPQEARTIAAALLAVRQGRSAEREIFLSPIASDDSFQAMVEADGVRSAGTLLSWPGVEALAADLARCAGAE